jgi:hypothetical protein
LGGAIARVADDATRSAIAVPVHLEHRTPHGRAQTRTSRRSDGLARLSAAVQLFSSGTTYVNFLGDAGEERVRSAYRAAPLKLLQALTRTYHPLNVFRLNQNPTAAETGVIGGESREKRRLRGRDVVCYRAGVAKVLSGYAYGLYQLDDRARARPVLDECIALMRELNDRFGLAWALEVDALINIKDGLLDDARTSIAESLRIFAAAGDLSGVTLLLMDSAILAALGGDLDRAVRLFAASEQLAEAREEGRRLSREEAVVLAVS